MQLHILQPFVGNTPTRPWIKLGPAWPRKKARQWVKAGPIKVLAQAQGFYHLITFLRCPPVSPIPGLPIPVSPIPGSPIPDDYR